MPIKKLLQRPVLTLPPDASCMQAAMLMRSDNVGAVVVAEEGRPQGMVTDRDLAVRVMAKGLDPHQVLLREVMSGTPIFLSEARGLDECITFMREMRVRRMMVVDAEGNLSGLISMDDLIVLIARQVGELADVARLALQAPARESWL